MKRKRLFISKEQERIMENRTSYSRYFFFFFPFFIWLFAFRGFLFDDLGFTSDAISYYNHIKFNVESLGQGVFPLWDPVWSGGVPNRFFLQRFGAYNPCYVFILILNKMGLSYMTSYLGFLSGYYFFGMIGFYKLAQRLFYNPIVSLTAYLLLMFSSLGTRLFDSYFLLIVVPGIWFFYCLVSFAQEQKKYHLLGITFTLMILATTYIPFYFLIIFSVFLFCFTIIYFNSSVKFLMSLCKHKALVLACSIAIILSLIPGILFMQESSSGAIVMPSRSSASTEAHQLSVGLETITSWGMLEDIAYSIPFLKDITTFKFAVIYVPPIALLILLFGLFTKITRRSLLLFCWCISLFIMFSPHAPVYHFLHKHIFFFKYFRNLHFFLWFAILPIFILFVCEQLRGLFSVIPAKAGIQICRSFDKFFKFIKPTTRSPIKAFGDDKLLNKVSIILLFMSVVIHPLITYHYLNKNTQPSSSSYQYDRPYQEFSFINNNPMTSLYYTTQDYQEFLEQKGEEKAREYLQHKFMIRDGDIERFVTKDTKDFQVTHYDMNSIRFKTNFNEGKFIIYNDAFHKRWEAYVNGKRINIVKANIAFKGIQVPAGESEVFLRYGSMKLYVWNYFLMALFYGMFGWIIVLKIKSIKNDQVF